MMGWTRRQRIGAGAFTFVTVVALATSVSLIGSVYRVVAGPAAAELGVAASDTPGSPGVTSSPAPSLIPESGDSWSTAFSITPTPYSRLDGLAEVGGSLLALGRSDRNQPAIWLSRDGTNWTAAQVPSVTERLASADGSSTELAAIVRDVEDAGVRLVALATVGLADGSGPIGTMIYVSDDTGLTWSKVTGAPGSTAAAMFELGRRGDSLIAAGTAIWASGDGGLTWSEIVDATALGGALKSVDASGDLIVAAGDGGNGDVTSPPATVMVSADGRSWERTVLDSDGVAHEVAIGNGGQIVVAGHVNADVRVWVSNDAGKTWETVRPQVGCCVTDLVSTPDGYVATVSGPFDGMLTSTDGLTWKPTATAGGPELVHWGPVYGLVGATDDAILVNRRPAP